MGVFATTLAIGTYLLTVLRLASYRKPQMAIGTYLLTVLKLANHRIIGGWKFNHATPP